MPDLKLTYTIGCLIHANVQFFSLTLGKKNYKLIF